MKCIAERNHGFGAAEGRLCCCAAESHFLSKKKRIQNLENILTRLREKAEDIEEYINELKA